MQRYTGEKEPGILEEERRDGRQDCGRGGGAGGAGRGHSYFILSGMRRSKMAQALSVLFTPVFPDLEQCLLAHGRTSINICCLKGEDGAIRTDLCFKISSCRKVCIWPLFGSF